jgi:hypothetical protein
MADEAFWSTASVVISNDGYVCWVRESEEKERRRGGGLEPQKKADTAPIYYGTDNRIPRVCYLLRLTRSKLQSASLIPKQIHTAKPDGNTVQRPRRPPEKQPSYPWIAACHDLARASWRGEIMEGH